MLKLIVIQAQFGDCLMLQSSDGSNPISILIDGGPSQTYEKHLKPTLNTVLHSTKLDLVILSHIDNDHVLGLLDLFEAIKREKDSGGSEVLRVTNLWHNSFSDLIRSNSYAIKLMRSLFSSNQFFTFGNDNKIVELPAISALKGISEGRDLTKLAQNLNIPINSQFGSNPIIFEEEEYKIIELGNIKFHILGPTQKSLDSLKKIWADWERQHLQAEVTNHDFQAIQALDSSITNLSSVMFLMESEGKRLLFSGDGLGDNIIESLSKRELLDSQGRLHVDVLKVPHHGSERNVSEQFFETVTADVYVISADGRYDNPSFLTLKWIIENGHKYNRKTTILATNKTDNIEKALQIYDPIVFKYKFIFLEPQADFFELDVQTDIMIR